MCKVLSVIAVNLAFLITASQVVAAPQVIVEVRTVRALKRHSDPLQQSKSISVDDRLQDLRVSLEKLPFSQFSLVAAERVVGPLKRQNTINLINGETLTLRPLSYSRDNVCLWLKWVDKQGSQILNTRMHFTPGQGLLVGTDSIQRHQSNPENGLVLAIQVSSLDE